MAQERRKATEEDAEDKTAEEDAEEKTAEEDAEKMGSALPQLQEDKGRGAKEAEEAEGAEQRDHA